MKEKKKQGLFEICITAVKILLFVLLVFSGFVFVYYGLINKSDPVKSESIRIVTGWNVTENATGDQTVVTDLPEDIKDNEYLFFETRTDVSVSIGGKFRKDFIEKRDVNSPGGSFTKFLMSVPLRQEDAGMQVVIFRKSPQSADRDVPEIFVGTRSSAVTYLYRTMGLSFILSLIVLIFSFVVYIVSLVLRFMFKHRIDMTYGALGIFTIAAWLISDSELFPFAFGTYHINGILSFLFCLIMPLPLGVYLFSIQRGRYKTAMSVILLLGVINATIWPILHFTGLVHFSHLRTAANVLLVVLAVSGITILLVDAIKGKIREYRYTFAGFLVFLFGGLLGLLATIFEISFIKASIAMVSGLAFLLTFIVIQQVHDLRMINAEKQRAIDISEAKTRFLASMSHEIRTPINAILGMNEMILRENSDKTIEEYSKNIKTSGKMLLMLVNDVLDFTKIEAGKLEIKEESFLMSDLLYDVVSMIKERAEEKSLNLETHLTDEVPDALISDEFRIRQILINLLTNAVKYTEKGTVTLNIGGAYSEDDYELKLLVKDTGKGIRSEDKDHLFEAFSRADLKNNANIEGTGLGLAIVKSIVDSMKGELGVESEYGEGSQFWVKIPVKVKDKEPLTDDFMNRKNTQKAESTNCSFTAPEAKILAVDDNQSNLTIVKLFLKRNGIVPDLCTTGTRAIELCREKKYDLILLDHMMPEPDGIETLHAIKEDEKSLNKETKVLVLTANAVAGSRQMYINEGFDDYLTKPLDSDVLEEAVKKMLPKEKVSEVTSGASDASNPADSMSLKGKLSAIAGLDYETALRYCADEEELLIEILSDIAKEAPARVKRMREDIKNKDFAAYKIEAHAVKSSSATIGLKEFSERAKKHEFAARDNDTSFIYGDVESFISEYEEIFKKLKEITGDKNE